MIAIVIVALIVLYVLFNNRPPSTTGWNGVINYPLALSLPLFV